MFDRSSLFKTLLWNVGCLSVINNAQITLHHLILQCIPWAMKGHPNCLRNSHYWTQCFSINMKGCKNYCIHTEFRLLSFFVITDLQTADRYSRSTGFKWVVIVITKAQRVPIIFTQAVLLCPCIRDFHTKTLYVFSAPTIHTVHPAHRDLLHFNFWTPPPDEWYCPPYSTYFSCLHSKYFREKFVF